LTELPLTHEVIATMLGGPRHAVSIVLHELRDTGAIEYQRGRIRILDAARLGAHACECYSYTDTAPVIVTPPDAPAV